MSARLPPAVLVALLVVLAGCGGFGGNVSDGSSPDERPATTQPTAAGSTGADPATTGGDSLPPGVTDTGLRSPEALAAAHTALLRNHSYTVNYTEVSRFENGSLAIRLVQVVHRSGERVLYEARDSGPLTEVGYGDTSVWIDGSTGVRLDEDPDGTLGYDRPSVPRGFVPDTERWGAGLRDRVDGGEFSVERLDGGDRPRYRLVSDDLDTVEAVTNATIRVVVDDRGFVHRYRYELDQALAGTPVHVVVLVRFSDLGETTVPRPDWVDEALNETAE